MLADVDRLISPLGGVVSRVARLDHRSGDPDYRIFGADLGDLGQLFDHVAVATAGDSSRAQMNGAGSDRDAERASRLAAMEGLERYATCVFHEDQFVWATARDLGAEALPLDSLPRVSDAEAAAPGCPLRRPDPDAPLRWVRGVSLVTGEERWVPAMLVYLYIAPKSDAERIWLPISTGCAAHTETVAALGNALCEVIERDAISLTWLLRPELPRLELDDVPPEAAPFLERNRSDGVESLLFDATTDLGIPTVYCLERTPWSEMAQLVTCSTELDPRRAVVKVLREAASTRIALVDAPPPPNRTEDFHDVMHGATYMAHPARRAAFAFLEDSPARRLLSDLPRLGGVDPDADLALLVGRLAAAGMEVVAVDLTCDELDRLGFRAVRVVVPGLQPLSFSPLVQYRDHPRLAQAAQRMGWPVPVEADLNPWPQPFA